MLSALSTRMGARARRTLAAATVLLAFAGATACGDDDDDDGTGPDDETGTYALEQVDDEDVPTTFTIVDAGENPLFDITFNSGNIQLQDGGRYTATFDVEIDDGTGPTAADITDQGDYDIAAGAITFTSDDDETEITGQLSGDNITLPNVGFDFDDDGVDDLDFKFELTRP